MKYKCDCDIVPNEILNKTHFLVSFREYHTEIYHILSVKNECDENNFKKVITVMYDGEYIDCNSDASFINFLKTPNIIKFYIPNEEIILCDNLEINFTDKIINLLKKLYKDLKSMKSKLGDVGIESIVNNNFTYLIFNSNPDNHFYFDSIYKINKIKLLNDNIIEFNYTYMYYYDSGCISFSRYDKNKINDTIQFFRKYDRFILTTDLKEDFPEIYNNMLENLKMLYKEVKLWRNNKEK